MALDLEEIFKQHNIQYTKVPEYYKVLCPFHDDTNPSGNIHQKYSRFHCFACGKKTSLLGYLTKATGLTLEQVKIKFGAKSDCKHPVSPLDVEQDHVKLWECADLLQELRHRCITDEIIRRYRLGARDSYYGRRVSIPIKNDVGEYVNLRLYAPGATTNKFLQIGRKENNRIRFTPVEQFEYDHIVVCAGELKAYLAAEILNPYDIGAVAPTSSEVTAWPTEENYRFKDKLVSMLSDVDETGVKCSELRCRIVRTFAREIHLVTLPLDKTLFPKGDLNDFIRIGGNLLELITNAPEWAYTPGGVISDDLIQDVSFREGFHQASVEKRMRFTGVVSGYSSTTYFVPAMVHVSCTRDKEYCAICDIITQPVHGLDTHMRIHPEHKVLLELVQEKEVFHPMIYKECFHIPKQCNVCKFSRKEEYSISEVALEEELEATSREEPMSLKLGYIVNGPPVMDNQVYNLTGRLYPSPKNQAATFLASKCEPTLDSLDAYVPDPETNEYLKVFEPREWTLSALEEKLNDIYQDLEANVTQCYRRRDLHIAIDLVYHSILHFDFLSSKEVKTCVELLVVGDTSEGKSTAIKGIMQHYGLGTKVDCANISLAGLTIGLSIVEKRKLAIYGVLPRNDKKLVVFEELRNMREDILHSLTEIRSSGLVQITKIEQKFKKARVRLIMISNPREDGRTISSYTYGIEAAISLIGTNQDLRRFDFVLIVGKEDNPDGIPEIKSPPAYPHKYIADLCQKLVLKAWKCDRVVFEDTTLVMETVGRLIEKFGSGTPILDANSSHMKVAKLAAAIAARTHSYDSDTLIVRKCHIEFIEQYLTRIYSAPTCRLGEKSKAIRDSGILRNAETLLKYISELANSEYIAQKLIETDAFGAGYIRDLVGEQFVSATLLSRLIQSNAVYRIKHDRYVKNPEFTDLLKQKLSNGLFHKPLPEYLKKEKF